MEKDRMVILAPPKKWEEYKLTGETPEKISSGTNFIAGDDMLKKAIAYYQSASDSFRRRLIGLEKQYPASINVRIFAK
jgi:hypothetical protein